MPRQLDPNAVHDAHKNATIGVDQEDLEAFIKLFKECAEVLRMEFEDELAIECEQTAELIEGFYLPCPEK
jgi:hypothetical protein